MTSSNGIIFRVTGHSCGEFTGHKGQWREALMFSLICTRKKGWVNNGEAGDLRRHRAHYDVTVMWIILWCHWAWFCSKQDYIHLMNNYSPCNSYLTCTIWLPKFLLSETGKWTEPNIETRLTPTVQDWGPYHWKPHERGNLTFAMSMYKWAPVSCSGPAAFHLATCVCTSNSDRELTGPDKACVPTHAPH